MLPLSNILRRLPWPLVTVQDDHHSLIRAPSLGPRRLALARAALPQWHRNPGGPRADGAVTGTGKCAMIEILWDYCPRQTYPWWSSTAHIGTKMLMSLRSSLSLRPGPDGVTVLVRGSALRVQLDSDIQVESGGLDLNILGRLPACGGIKMPRTRASVGHDLRLAHRDRS